MRILIIGLGIYGSNLAIDLSNMGHEVIGADIKPSLVESIKDYISTAYILDSTDETALDVLPIKNVDLVIVAIGENFGASIRTVAIMKKNGVKHIYARAIDKLHEAILEGFDIDRILTPEQRAASDLVNEMGLGHTAESMKLDDEFYVLKFVVPEIFVGTKFALLNLEKDFGLRLIAVTRLRESRNILGINHKHYKLIDLQANSELTVEANDTFTCIGNAAQYRTLFKRVDQ